MPTAYEIGQEVIIKPVDEQSVSLREAAILSYAGQTATISNYHWIAPPTRGVFYLYTVRVGNSNKEIVLYEDEITYASKTKSKLGKVKDK
ncbi:hypothetical protein ACFLTZ_02290 [Chloroflexota bacterium]